MKITIQFLSIFLFLVLNTAYCSAQETYKQWIGVNYKDTKHLNRRDLENNFDSLIHVQYKFDIKGTSSKMINTLSYKDTVVLVQIWTDNFLLDDTSTLDITYIDSVKFLALEEYFKNKYSQKPDTSSFPTSFVEMREGFGISVGLNALPRGKGKMYRKLEKKQLSSEYIARLLVSLNPYKQLVGYLLYNPKEHQISNALIELVLNSTFDIDYHYGCGGATWDLNTIKKVALDIKR